MPIRRFLITLAAALALHAGIARAEIMVVDSLEWLAADAPLIVQAKVADFAESRGLQQVVYRDLTLANVKILKGDVKPENIALRLRVLGDDPLGQSWKTSGDTFIFFLEPGKNDLDSDMGGHSVLRGSALDLDHPARVFTAAMKEATDRDEILKIIAAYKDTKKDAPPVGTPNIFKPQRGYVRMEIPFDAPIHRQVFAGSACYINVPADETAHATAIKLSRSEQVMDRIHAAEMLLNFPGPETAKILTALLDDPNTGRKFENNTLTAITYPVRQSAYNTLVHDPALLDRDIAPTPAELDAAKPAAKPNP